MLVVRGVNIYPQQIERVLMAVPELGRNYLIHLHAWTRWCEGRALRRAV